MCAPGAESVIFETFQNNLFRLFQFNYSLRYVILWWDGIILKIFPSFSGIYDIFFAWILFNPLELTKVAHFVPDWISKIRSLQLNFWSNSNLNWGRGEGIYFWWLIFKIWLLFIMISSSPRSRFVIPNPDSTSCAYSWQGHFKEALFFFIPWTEKVYTFPFFNFDLPKTRIILLR